VGEGGGVRSQRGGSRDGYSGKSEFGVSDCE